MKHAGVGPIAISLCLGLTWAGIQSVSAATGEEIARAKAHFDSGDYPAAEEQYHRVIDSLGDKRDEDYLDAITGLGTCYYYDGAFKRAATLYRRSIELDEKLHGKDSLRVADDLLNLTRALRRQYLWDDAEPVMARTLDIRRRMLGDNHKLVAMSWMDLAVNYQRQHKYAESESAFLKTIEIRDNLHDNKQSAIAYWLYAKLLNDMNRPGDSHKVRLHAAQLDPDLEF